MTYYEINVLLGILFTLAGVALFTLMLILWPRNRLNRLAFFYIGCRVALDVRWVAATIWPEQFGIKESLYASVFYAVATLITVVFAAVAWWEHMREARR